jgi:hypothetical protein
MQSLIDAVPCQACKQGKLSQELTKTSMNTWVYSFHDVNRHSHPRAAFMLPEEPTSSYEDPFGLAKDDTGPTGVPLFESLRVK